MRFITKKIEEMTADTVVIYAFEDIKNDSELFKYLDNLSNNELTKQIYKFKTTKNSLCETFKYSINENLKVLVVGLGKKENLTRQKFSQATASASRVIKNMSKNKTVAFEIIDNISDCESSSKYFNKKDASKIALCAIRIGLYEFDKYLSEKKNAIETIELIDNDITKDIEQGAEIGAYTSFAMKFA